MDYEAQIEYQKQVEAVADRLVEEALARGEAFSEALCSWAWNEAERRI